MRKGTPKETNTDFCISPKYCFMWRHLRKNYSYKINGRRAIMLKFELALSSRSVGFCLCLLFPLSGLLARCEWLRVKMMMAVRSGKKYRSQ